MNQVIYSRIFALSSVVISTTIGLIATSSAIAQIVPDNTLGSESSVVTPNQNIRGINSDRIDGGAVRGGNLFHSFQEFNIEDGRGAYFSNPDNIINILTRVTGGNISEILGTLGVLGNANFFLINPNGIVFGPNAQLDVGGSFFATTADGILFENGIEFAASNPEAPPLLTINMPLGLNIRENPGRIVNQATPKLVRFDGSLLRNEAGFLIPQSLNVPQNQTLALIGGDVIFDNAIAISPGSNIELGGLSEPGIVQLNSDGSLTFPTNIQRSNIALTNESQINVRSDGGGNININAGNVEISGGSIIRTGIDQGLGSPEARSGDVNINAQENILITGEESSIRNVIDTDGVGQLGNVNITTKTLTLEEDGEINYGIFGQGNGGSISVLATESVNLFNGFILSGVEENAVGEVGDIKITTPLLNGISGQIVIATSGNGNIGSIQLEAQQINLSDSIIAVETSGLGNVGNITINTGSLVVRDGTDIRLDVKEEATGSTGNIIVNASEQIEISGVASEVSMIDSEISPLVRISSRIKTSTDGSGNAGSVFINTPRLIVRDGGSIFAASFNEGRAGDVTINASESVEVSGFSVQPDGSLTSSDIETFSLPFFAEDFTIGGGSAGDVVITTGKLTIRDGGSIAASTFLGQGDVGSVSIRANEVEVFGGTVEVFGDITSFTRSSISVTTTFSDGDAGSVTIDTNQLVVQGGAEIETFSAGTGSTSDINIQANVIELVGTSPDNISSSQIETGVLDVSEFDDFGLIPAGTGNSGNINIVTQQLRLRDGGRVLTSASSGQGDSGNITVQATDIELIGASSPLEAGFSLDSSGFSSRSDVGNAGNIIVETERLAVRDGARISASTSGEGNAGEINIQAQQIELTGITQFSTPLDQSGLFSFTLGSGNAGQVTIETEQLVIREGALISTGVLGNSLDEESEISQPTTGSGGTVTIRASQSVDLNAFALKDNRVRLSSISSSTQDNTVGDGGTVILETERLTVRDGAEISAFTSGEGDAGSVEIQAQTIELVGTARDGELPSRVSAEVTESAIGEGGTVDVNAQQLTVREGANITVSSQGEGNPGNLQVNVTDRLRLDTEGSLTAESATGQGGNIGIRSRDMRLRRQSEISATGSETGATQEGNITIDTNLLVLLEGSRILTDASNPTGGSNITIRPLNGSGLAIIQSQDSLIRAAGELSIDDTLNFDPPEALEVTVVDPAALIAQDPCKQRGDSEFIITGRGGIAPDPTQELTSIEGLVEWESFLVEPVTPPVRRSSQRHQYSKKRDNNRENHPVDSRTIVPARGWIRTEEGEVILVGYDPTQTGVARQANQPIQCHSHHDQ